MSSLICLELFVRQRTIVDDVTVTCRKYYLWVNQPVQYGRIFMSYTLSEPSVKLPLSLYFRLLLQTRYLIPSRDQGKKQRCKLLCYVRSQAYCYVPPQTLMKVSCESGRRIRAEIQTFRLSPKLARGSLGDREIRGVRGRKETRPSARLEFHGLQRIPARAWEGLNVSSALSACIAS